MDFGITWVELDTCSRLILCKLRVRTPEARERVVDRIARKGHLAAIVDLPVFQGEQAEGVSK